MGMFDYVRFELHRCPKCKGGPVRGFQSKDLSCDMVTVDIQALQRWYDVCDKCEAWLECRWEIDASTDERRVSLRVGDLWSAPVFDWRFLESNEYSIPDRPEDFDDGGM